MNELLLFLFGGIAAGALVGGLRDTRRVRNLLQATHNRGQYFPKVLGMLMLVANASEITRVIGHSSMFHIAAALLLFVLWAATKNREVLEEA